MSEIFVIGEESFDGVEQQLKRAQEVMLRNLNKTSTRYDDMPNEVKEAVRKDPTSFAVIINGHSLVRKSGC